MLSKLRICLRLPCLLTAFRRLLVFGGLFVLILIVIGVFVHLERKLGD